MVKKLVKKAKALSTEKSAPKSNVSPEEERILQAAVIYLIRKVGGLLVPTALREEQIDGRRHWIIGVTLRYPTGHEGYVGDLLYDGKEFSKQTPDEVWRERIRQIAADPEGIREWNEYRASTLRAGKA